MSSAEESEGVFLSFSEASGVDRLSSSVAIEDDYDDDDEEEEWLSVERGAVRDRLFAPSDRVEQLQFVTQRLSREIQNAGRVSWGRSGKDVEQLV